MQFRWYTNWNTWVQMQSKLESIHHIFKLRLRYWRIMGLDCLRWGNKHNITTWNLWINNCSNVKCFWDLERKIMLCQICFRCVRKQPSRYGIGLLVDGIYVQIFCWRSVAYCVGYWFDIYVKVRRDRPTSYPLRSLSLNARINYKSRYKRALKINR